MSVCPYIQDEGSFPLLVENWGAIEEVLLLDAVEQDGFGNWYIIGEGGGREGG